MHLTELRDLSERDVQEIFRLTRMLKKTQEIEGLKAGVLRGRTFALLFPPDSLRTRIAFEKGIRCLGGETMLFSPEALSKGEAAADMAGYLENWVDGLIVRHPDPEVTKQLAASAKRLRVINAMSRDNHPCEVLSDLYGISERRPDYRELVYTFIGPSGNIARTWADAAAVLGLRFRHAAPEGHRLSPDGDHYRFDSDPSRLLPGTDVLLTDSLPDSCRNNAYYDIYQVTPDMLAAASPDVLFNPCPPFRRGEEISEAALASDAFVGYAFKDHLLSVQQAILIWSFGLWRAH